MSIHNFNNSPADIFAQHARVIQALQEFLDYWKTFENMPYTPLCDGSLNDIDALDYMVYEGLGDPPSGFHCTAIVWGNVLVKRLGMVWATDPEGALLLTHNENGFRFTLWPYARVLEIKHRNLPQDGKYYWLFKVALEECLQVGDFSDEIKVWCKETLME